MMKIADISFKIDLNAAEIRTVQDYVCTKN